MVLHSALGVGETEYEVGFIEEETDGGMSVFSLGLWDFIRQS